VQLQVFWSGSDRSSADSLLKTLQSNDTFNALKALKEASASGASGLGQVTEREIDLLMNELGSIDLGTSDENIDRSIKMAANRYHNIMQKISMDKEGRNMLSKEQLKFYKDREMVELENTPWAPEEAGDNGTVPLSVNTNGKITLSSGKIVDSNKYLISK
jgi:uncharacterized membrane protein